MNESERPAIDGSNSIGDHSGLDDSTPDSPETGAMNHGEILPDSYRSCLDAIPDLMALKGEDLEYLFVNKAFCGLTGSRQREILGTRARDIFPNEIARKLETMDLLVLASLKESTEEMTINGRVYEIRKFPVNLHDRGLVVVSGRDITERKESEKALLSEKIRFQIISDNTPVGMILLEGQGTVKYANGRFREIFGYDEDDVPDGATWFRKAFPEEEEYETTIAAVICHADEVPGWKGREGNTMVATRRDGTRRLVTLEATQLISGDVIVSCHDLSERLRDASTALAAIDYDALTGLPSRASLERGTRIAVARATEKSKRRASSALLTLTIADFQGLKKTRGAGFADEAMAAFARLLKSILREGDVAYRSGEDSFAVMFKGISSAEARLAAERIHQSMGGSRFLTGSPDLPMALAVVVVPIEGTDDAPALLALSAKMTEEARITDLNRIHLYDPGQTALQS